MAVTQALNAESVKTTNNAGVATYFEIFSSAGAIF
jgi:hypothetical protein